MALVASSKAVESVSSELSALSNNIFIKAGNTLLIDGSFYINGTLTSSATQVNVTIPLNKIILASTVELISGKMLFRQNGKYYVGSADNLPNILDVGVAKAWITPIGIRLYVIFNKAVAAQNNAPVAAQLLDLKFKFS